MGSELAAMLAIGGEVSVGPKAVLQTVSLFAFCSVYLPLLLVLLVLFILLILIITPDILDVLDKKRTGCLE